MKEIAKRIYDEIQVLIEENKHYSYLIFAFKDCEFIEYFFSDELYYSNDDTVYCGLTFEYENMSIKDIEEELLYAQNNQCDKNTFDKLVELAKEGAEREVEKLSIEYQNIQLPVSWIPKNGIELLMVLDEWYNNIMLAAGYIKESIERNIRHFENYEYYKLANAIDTWYQTEIYPKICESYPEIKRKRVRRCINKI